MARRSKRSMTSTLETPPNGWSPVSLEHWTDAAQLFLGVARPTKTEGPRTLTGARRAAGLTMTDLARVLHVSRPIVSLWEQGGRRPARQYWPALGAALDLTPSRSLPCSQIVLRHGSTVNGCRPWRHCVGRGPRVHLRGQLDPAGIEPDQQHAG